MRTRVPFLGVSPAIFTLIAAVLTYNASAGVVVSVAGFAAGADQDGNGVYLPYDSGRISGSQSAGTGHNETAVGSGTVSIAGASANLVDPPDPGLHIGANANAGNQGQSEAWSMAQWGDVIRLSPVSRSSDYLSVTFSIRGEYGYTSSVDYLYLHQLDIVAGMANFSDFALDATSIRAYHLQSGSASLPVNNGLASASAVLALRRGSQFEIGDLNQVISLPEGAVDFYALEPIPPPPGSTVSKEFIVGEFGWTQTFLVPYKAEIGGYNLNVIAFSGAEAYLRGSAGIDAYNTFTLETVAYSNGEAITGPITFDSGFVLPINAVPEPSSLIIVTTMLGMVLLSRRGRRIFARIG